MSGTIKENLKGKFDFELYHFFHSGVMPLFTSAWSEGIHIVWTYSSIIFLKKKWNNQLHFYLHIPITYTVKKINCRPVANATKISIGQPILRVAIAQLATYKIYLTRCLRCQSHSEHVKFNYVESPYKNIFPNDSVVIWWHL